MVAGIDALSEWIPEQSGVVRSTKLDKLNSLGLSDLLNLLGVARFDPGGSSLFPGAERRITKRIKGLEGDPNLAPDFQDASEVTPFLSQFSTAFGRRGSKVRGRISEAVETAEREEVLANAKTMLDEFRERGDYDALLERIRSLPPTFDDFDIDLLKNRTVNAAKQGELAAQRRIAANLGIRGAGAPGGVGAYLAQKSAAATDQAISSAFTAIDLERMTQDQEDLLRALGLEQGLLGARQSEELRLQQNIQNILSGLPPTGPIQEYSALLEAIRSQTLAAEMERDRSDAGTKAGFMDLLGTVGGAAIGSLQPV